MCPLLVVIHGTNEKPRPCMVNTDTVRAFNRLRRLLSQSGEHRFVLYGQNVFAEACRIVLLSAAR